MIKVLARSNPGMTLVEALVGVFILATLTTAITGLASLGTRTAVVNEQRTVAQALANEQAEMIRALPYQQVGYSDAQPCGAEFCEPDGVVERAKTVTRNVNQQYELVTHILLVDEEMNGRQPVPLREEDADYKKVLVRVYGPSASLGAARSVSAQVGLVVVPSTNVCEAASAAADCGEGQVCCEGLCQEPCPDSNDPCNCSVPDPTVSVTITPTATASVPPCGCPATIEDCAGTSGIRITYLPPAGGCGTGECVPQVETFVCGGSSASPVPSVSPEASVSPSTPPVVLTGGAENHRLFWTGSEFGLFYSSVGDSVGSLKKILVARFDPRDGWVGEAQMAEVDQYRYNFFRGLWNGDAQEYVLAYDETEGDGGGNLRNQSKFSRVNRDGVWLGETVISNNLPFSPSGGEPRGRLLSNVAWNNTNREYGIIRKEGGSGRVELTRLSPSGDRVGSSELRTNFPIHEVLTPLIWTGDKYAFVFGDQVDASGKPIETKGVLLLVAADGSLMREVPLQQTANTFFKNWLWNGSEFAIVSQVDGKCDSYWDWRIQAWATKNCVNGKLVLMRVAADGQRLATAVIESDLGAPRWQNVGHVADYDEIYYPKIDSVQVQYDGANYGVAYKVLTRKAANNSDLSRGSDHSISKLAIVDPRTNQVTRRTRFAESTTVQFYKGGQLSYPHDGAQDGPLTWNGSEYEMTFVGSRAYNTRGDTALRMYVARFNATGHLIEEQAVEGVSPLQGWTGSDWAQIYNSGSGTVNVCAAEHDCALEGVPGQLPELVDNGDNWAFKAADGAQCSYAGAGGFHDGVHSCYRLRTPGGAVASWKWHYVPPGSYNLYARWEANADSPSAAMSYVFWDGAAMRTVTVNPRQSPAGLEMYGLQWQQLGEVQRFDAGRTDLEVAVVTANNDRVNLDALMLVPDTSGRRP